MWRFLHASVVGQSHRSAGAPCQDASRALQVRAVNGEEVLILLCSDGAGSAEFSAVGSRAACHRLAGLAVQFLRQTGPVEAVTREISAGWLADVRRHLDEVARAHNAAVRDFACTLVAALIGEKASAFLQVGDGAVVVRRKEHYEVVFWPQTGDYANTTFFVTEDSAAERMAFDMKDMVDEVAAFTDGVQALALTYATRQPFDGFFSPIFAALRRAKSPAQLRVPFLRFLDSPRINERTEDDKSLIVAVRLTSQASASDRVQ